MSRPTASPVLLSPSDSRARARSLLSWNIAQRDLVKARLNALFANWCGEWGLSALMDGAVPAIHLLESQALEVLENQLFGSRPLRGDASIVEKSSLSLAQILVMKAWEDWIKRLADVCGLDACMINDFQQCQTDADTNPPAEWDGCFDIAFPWWEGFWAIRLEAPAVKHILGSDSQKSRDSVPALQVKLIPLSDALMNQQLAVSVQFSPVSLSLGEIQNLRIGDVIPLSHRLDQPASLLLQLTPRESVPLCDAWPGKQNGRMAVELSAAAF